MKEVWRLADSRRPVKVMLPLSTEYADFNARFEDALESLGYIHDWDAGELLEQIAATRADLFFVRLDQPMTDATIPFQQAEKTLQALHKMLKAAATTAADPRHSHQGRRPARVAEFLDEDVRLGHTKRGSFVFTVMARMGDPSTEAQTEAAAALGAPPADAPAPYPRQVMETLARGLETTRRLTQEWVAALTTSPAETGLSAALVESVEDIARPEHLQALDLSFEWAAAGPPPRVELTSIVLDRASMAGLPRIRERLVRQEEPPRRETLVGLVKALARDESTDDEAATITLATEVAGRPRSVHIPLADEDHNWAILAYQQKLPFTVTGDLAFERRAWRLTGDIVVDASFLQHHSGSASPPG